MTTRTLPFPADRVVGTVMIAGAPHPGMGDLEVPKDVDIELAVSAEGCADSTWLEAVPPAVAEQVTKILLAPNPEGADELIARLSAFTNLQEFFVMGPSVTDAGVASLSTHAALKFLFLGGPSITDLRPVARLQGLKRFVATVPSLSAEGLGGLSSLPLAQLILDIGDSAEDALLQLAGLPQVWAVALTAGALTGPGLAFVADLPRLRTLSVTAPLLGDEGLVHIGRASSLRYLSLRLGDAATDEGLAHLAKLSELRELRLDPARQATDDTTRSATSPRFTAAGLGSLSSLRLLQIPAAAVTDEGIEAIARLESLKTLHVEDLSDSAASALAAARPGLLVNAPGGSSEDGHAAAHDCDGGL